MVHREEQPGFDQPREEREEYDVSASNDGIVQNCNPKKHFIELPEGIQNFTGEQIQAFAEAAYDQIASILNQTNMPEPTMISTKDEDEK